MALINLLVKSIVKRTFCHSMPPMSPQSWDLLFSMTGWLQPMPRRCYSLNVSLEVYFLMLKIELRALYNRATPPEQRYSASKTWLYREGSPFLDGPSMLEQVSNQQGRLVLRVRLTGCDGTHLQCQHLEGGALWVKASLVHIMPDQPGLHHEITGLCLNIIK